MSEHITAYPLTWPNGWKRTHDQEHALFSKKTSQYQRRKITVSDAVGFVLDELRRMGIPDFKVIISTDLKLRLDGLPYSGQKEPDDQGASVWWKDGSAQKVIAIDKYHRVADNIYAIGKTIEALRGIERWGSGEVLERTFTGFTALPNLSPEGWWEIIDLPQHTPTADVLAAFKKARFRSHPDQGGSTESFNLINDAYEQFRAQRGLQS